MTTKRYAYRAYPTREQAAHLARVFGCCRVAFNDAIAFRENARAEGRTVTTAQVSANLTASKKTPQRAWLAEVSSVALQQAIADAAAAYRNFFASIAGVRKGKRAGKPRFKKRTGRQSARFTRNSGFKIRETTHDVGFVRLPGLGELRYVRSRPLPSEPSSVTVTKDTDGRYCVSFVVDVTTDVPVLEPLPVIDRAVGIDLGLTHLAVLAATDGSREKIANPRHLREAERRLKAAQRTLSRKQRGSANRDKARLIVAKRHAKVRRARADHHRKLAHRLVHENQVIVLEGLAVAGLMRTRMSKSIADAGWGLLTRCIQEKADQFGRKVVVIDRFEPTSQVCSVCGLKDGKKPLSVREWECGACGAWLDRDFNAAVNVLLAGGQSESLNACGPDVRQRLAAAVGVEAGTEIILAGATAA